MNKLKVADLFAGVGGISHGFSMAGFDIEFAIEYDKDIAYSFAMNHKNTDVYSSDISDINFNEIKNKHSQIDVIVGGPPCQGFSQKGKRLSLNDKRNYLYQKFVEAVKVFKPKYFLLENVPNIITTANGFFKNEIIKGFESLGYSVHSNILMASDFGVPQKRRRAFFLGKLGENELMLPKGNNSKVSVKDAIYDLPFIESGEGANECEYLTKAKSDYQKLMRKDSSVIYNHVATNHSKVALERLRLIPKGKGKEVLPKKHRTKSLYSGTWSRLIEDEQAATITTRFDTPSSGLFTHPVLDRCLTVREAARLQSFPDNFIFYGSKTSQMKQVGNAVPPLLAYNIALTIIKDNNYDSKSK